MSKGGDALHIHGAADGQIAPYLSRSLLESGKQCVLVTASASKARNLAKTLSFFMPCRIHVLHDDEPFFSRYEAKSREAMEARLSALADLRAGARCVVIAPAMGAIKRLPPPEAFDRHRLTLCAGDGAEPAQVCGRLAGMGYERAPFVEARGQFSARGGIVDVFAANGEAPLRIDFFGSEIESLREFDLESQRSGRALDSADLWPAVHMPAEGAVFGEALARISSLYDGYIRKWGGERAAALRAKKERFAACIESGENLQFLENYMGYFYEGAHYIWDYMRDGLLALDDPARVREAVALRERDAAADFRLMLERGQAAPEDCGGLPCAEDCERMQAFSPIVLFTPFATSIEGLGRQPRRIGIAAKQPAAINGRMDVLESELRRYVRQGYSVTIACSTEERIANLDDFLDRAQLRGRVALRLGSLAAGMEFPEEKTAYLWDGEIFAPIGRRRAARRENRDAAPIKAFTDIRKGDYVVHENHGIGRFAGIEQLEIQGVRRDYMKIRYAGDDMLYIPVEQMSIIQRYIGHGDAEPKVSRLSSGEWKRATARARKDIEELARELVEVSAARKATQGYAFSKDTLWQAEFEERFPYSETDDQLRSIESIKRDMEQPVPMDRLLCGDVGYGKTEVAARAVFKCVADGKQAAILVPTTILANQHFHTFRERFEGFPFEIEMLSRFRTYRQQREIAEKLGKGTMDVVIGTHRMLSMDIGFKDLGLLVIDEEQRFGVRHKERIKAMRKGVDVLTLSATPIPRTLHMSLMGIRDMDLIGQPPEGRYPVQTYVMEQTDDVLRETVRRELGRDGQVYVVFNRVKGIQRVAAEIKALVPEAEIAVGHGQMDEDELENVMMDFIAGRYSVLVSTTIIESGIDIPNVNTILVMDADRFGLSQLYQLRGRVGRSSRMAYAYLLYRKEKILSEAAEKRLRAIREFTEFGAGFRIAMRDLEIRGAGNILGMEQHGHMAEIGYELYSKLVDDAVRAIKGDRPSSAYEEVSFEAPVAAFIPAEYIEDEALKLQMYRKIAFIESKEDEKDMIGELEERFGDVPAPAANLIAVARIRAMSKRAGISRIREARHRYVFDMRDGAPVGPEDIIRIRGRYGDALALHGGERPYIALSARGGDKLKEIMEFIECLVL
ncbi:MAG: transcription-repair coupling factor [Clostridiales Family XIII bacterium]|jgi:transcription-repair coupling factor (superfamily II helicase)|nr:transcription-repair coupling factor [Clostridiales Family XIII bacterium]